jgi:hypothetical protein
MLGLPYDTVATKVTVKRPCSLLAFSLVDCMDIAFEGHFGRFELFCKQKNRKE